jgi:hypothetical protein
MRQQVNPDKVLELANGLKHLGRIIESEITGVNREITSVFNVTRAQYPERNVQTAANNMDSLLKEIRDLAISVYERLDKKTGTLTWAANEYRQAEQDAKIKQTKNIRERYDMVWGAYNKFGVGLYSWHKGYMFKKNGNYVHVYGSRNNTGLLNDSYMNWRRGDGLTGTRYRIDNSAVTKYTKLSTAIAEELNDSYNVANSKAWKNSLKGGGMLSAAFTVGGSVYDYRWGKHKDEGLASTEFASDLIVESGVTVGTTVISVTAGVGASAIYGAMFGSIVPGIGTAIGFVVGVVISYVISTDTGQKVINWAKEKVNDGLEAAIDIVKEAGDAAGEAISRVIGGIKSLF